jgi:hypothetical protein
VGGRTAGASGARRSRAIAPHALLKGWRRGELAVRRGLLRVLFDGLVVEDGAIVDYVPRAERAAEVVGWYGWRWMVPKSWSWPRPAWRDRPVRWALRHTWGTRLAESGEPWRTPVVRR